ncbi:MAG: hypothetical protein KGJ90_04590 [Patescibacteria group bacterium]|nr:hypothetical protein [Patescibacteria group bacterium]
MTVFTGYSSIIWQTIYATLVYYQDQFLNSDVTASAVEVASDGMLISLLNAVDLINANDTALAWSSESNQLLAIEGLPIVLAPADANALVNRQKAYASASSALYKKIPSTPYGQSSDISNGVAVIPDVGLLTFYQNFEYETPPTGLSSTNFAATASGIGDSFINIANAIQFLQGTTLTQLYDVATRQALTAYGAADPILNFTSGSVSSKLPLSQSWNQIVTLPAMAMEASMTSTSPNLFGNQQDMVIRYAMLTLATQIENFLLSLAKPQFTSIEQATIMVGDTLMDIAARELGDFELWPQIATLNNLFPPYVGPNTLPGVAGWGTQIILPGPNVSQSAIGTPPSYLNNFLGIDLYIGPINGEMPIWTGDFQTIAGYNNLAWALGRRLQTTLGTLIYHSDFGSRIPPEVGNVQTSASATRIAAFGKSALLSDPRVSSVGSPTSTLSGPNQITFNGQVIPSGFNSNPVIINEVISPLP